MDDYQFRTEPFSHQLADFERSRDLPSWALFWETGCAKTKPVIDTASYLFERGRIDGLLLVAPDIVHRGWLTRHMMVHMPERVLERCLSAPDPDDRGARRPGFIWNGDRAGNAGFQEDLGAFLGAQEGLAVLALTPSAIMTDLGGKALKTFLARRRCMLVADEAHLFKTPGAKRTKRLRAAAAHAAYRRVLTGTPIDRSPFDVYAQLAIADPEVWKRRGIPNYEAFQTQFGVFEVRGKKGARVGHGAWVELASYRNLEELRRIVQESGSRYLKRDVLDLPAKLYSVDHFELDPEQRRVYDSLEAEYVAWLEDGSQVTAELAIQRMVRLQQVCSGYVPADDETDLRSLGRNVRLQALEKRLEALDGAPAVIFAKYDVDVDQIRGLLGRDAVYFDGRTPSQERERAIQAFQHDRTARFFVGKASCAGAGHDLFRASQMLWYNNTYVMKDRIQGEDRIHRPGMGDEPATYHDLCAVDTVDEHVIDNLTTKRALAGEVLGDGELPPWIPSGRIPRS